MKTLMLICISFNLFASETSPDELYYQTDNKNTEKILIKNLNKMRVNAACFKKSKECSEFISKKPEAEKNETKLRGNPASIHCFAVGGESIILKDKKNNEYDYCRFQEIFMVDSWDLYEGAKK